MSLKKFDKYRRNEVTCLDGVPRMCHGKRFDPFTGKRGIFWEAFKRNNGRL